MLSYGADAIAVVFLWQILSTVRQRFPLQIVSLEDKLESGIHFYPSRQLHVQRYQ